MGVRPETVISQHAKASVNQSQNVSQSNTSEQVLAQAVAEDGGTATAIQISDQENENLQEGSAEAENIYGSNSGNSSMYIKKIHDNKDLTRENEMFNKKKNKIGKVVSNEAVVAFNGIWC